MATEVCLPHPYPLLLCLYMIYQSDPRKNGESADGLAIKEGSGTGNIVRGARLWNNVDDGLDFMLDSPFSTF